MTVNFPGGPVAAPTPDDPLGLLSACHGRIARQCETLRRLAAHLPAHGSDAAAQVAAAAVVRYFQTAALHHHEDEEEDLFPALIESMAGSDAVCLHALVDGLVADHARLAALWAPLRQTLSCRRRPSRRAAGGASGGFRGGLRRAHPARGGRIVADGRAPGFR